MRAAIGMDVGGTNVRAGVITTDGKLVGDIEEMKSPADGSFEDIVTNFLRLIQRCKKKADKKALDIVTCGIGIPGPFDYENGISQMRHKFAALYGKNIKTSLEKELEIPVFFLNDASAFGLGVARVEHPHTKRILVITIGTGLGSCFVTDGIMEDRTIWDFPFKDGILEDYISKRAIAEHYMKQSGMRAEVEFIANKAKVGDVAAKEAFGMLAKDIGEGLAACVASFDPGIVVFGGKIGTNAFGLFGKEAEKIYRKKSNSRTSFVHTDNEYIAVFGAADYSLKNL